MIRGVICNSAIDLGEKGPDFQYGYGALNALKAKECLTNNNITAENGFEVISLDNATNTIDRTITIANNNVAELRVMICWTEKGGTPNSTIALVNDIDLKVSPGSDPAEYFPWILNPKAPSMPAIRGEDHLNTIEQVTIQNPQADDYTINVRANSLPYGAQDVALIVTRIMKNKVNLLYPLGGEVLSPGNVERIRWEAEGANANAKVNIEFSENGNTWRKIATVSAQKMFYDWNVPQTTSKKAKIRVSKESSGTSQEFAIVGTPQNLRVSSDVCGNEALLEWNAVAGAEYYEVFCVPHDLNTPIATNISRTHFLLDGLSPNPDNFFAVRAVVNGVAGQRTPAIAVNPVSPITKAQIKNATTGGALDDFNQYFSEFYHLQHNKNANVHFVPKNPSDVFIRLEGGFVNEDWVSNSNQTHAWQNNTTHHASLVTCPISAAEVEDLMLEFDLRQRASFAPNHSWFRVLAKGTGNEFKALKDIKGRENFNPQSLSDDDWQHVVFDLSEYAGCNFTLKFQSSCKYASGVAANVPQGDVVDLDNIKLSVPPQHDIGVIAIKQPKCGPNLSDQEKIEVEVYNYGRQPVNDFTLDLYVDNTLVASENFTGVTIFGWDSKTFTFNATADLHNVGEHDIRIVATLTDDENSDNDQLQVKVENFGNLYVMESGFGHQVHIPQNGNINFVDDGRNGDYSAGFEGVVTFYPEFPGQMIAVDFDFLDIEANDNCLFDFLKIYNGNSVNAPLIAHYCGTNTPQQIVSGSYDGSLTFYFKSDENLEKAGWRANVSSIDPLPFDAGVIDIVSPTNGALSENQAITVRIKNFGSSTIENFVVNYQVDYGEVISETVVGPIAPNATLNYTFTQKANMADPYVSYRIDAFTALSGDQNSTNDMYFVKLTNSPNCTASGGGDEFIQYVDFGDIDNASGDEGYGDFHHLTTDVMFGESYPIVVTNGGGTYPQDVCGVWVDWDGNGNFDDGLIELKTNDGGYTFKGNIIAPPDAKEGVKSIRIRIQYDGDLKACGHTQFGEVEDYSLVLGGLSVTNDVGIKSIEMNEQVNFGPITPLVKVGNYGELFQSFDLVFETSDGYKISQKVTDLPPGEIREVSFPEWMPTGVGRVSVAAYIEIEDDRLSNNYKTQIVEVIEMQKAYAYNLGTANIPEGYVQFFLDDPSVVESINSNRIVPTCGTWVEDKWVVIGEYDEYLSYAIMYSIDPASGKVEEMAHIPFPIEALSYASTVNESFFKPCPEDGTGCFMGLEGNFAVLEGNPYTNYTPYKVHSGKLFGIGKGTDGYYLHKIDLETGAIDINKSVFLGNSIFTGLAANIIGELYAYNHTEQTLYFIDPITGDIYFLGETDFPSRYTNLDMEFDNLTGILYLIGTNDDTGKKELRTVDLLTGKTKLLGELGAKMATGLAIPYNFKEAASQNDFLDFGILNTNYQAIIDDEENTIYLETSPDEDLSGVEIFFKASPGATIEARGNPQQGSRVFDFNGNTFETRGNPQQGSRVFDFSNGPILFEITSLNGTTQQWIVNVAPPSSETNITEYGFNTNVNAGLARNVAATIDTDNRTINATVPFGTDISALIATFKLSAGATATVDASGIQKSGLTANDFSGGVLRYKVLAADRTTERIWTVFVNVAVGDENDIIYFGFDGTINPLVGVDIKANIVGNFVYLVLPDNAFLYSLKASFVLSEGAVATVFDALAGRNIVQESGVTINDFSKSVEFVVTAENGDKKTYWILTRHESDPDFDAIENNDKTTINIYPNPSKGFVNLTNVRNAKIQVFDLFGKLVHTEKASSNKTTIQLDNPAQGCYIIRILKKDAIVTKRIEIVR